MMILILGSGNNRQTFDLPSGREYRDLKKNKPVEAVKITGNIMGLVRRNAKKGV